MTGAAPMTPCRIQRKRTKGWKMPENTVYVGRPSMWGNPFVPDEYGIEERAHAVEVFSNMLKYGNDDDYPLEDEIRRHLRGKNLACWCEIVDQHGNYVPCHADVLLSLANQMTSEEVRDENIRRTKREAV